MKVLVTGGAGFIGSHLVERLVRDGFSVRVMDNLCTGRRENLSSVIRDVQFFEGDIRDTSAVERATRGVEAVFHLAALGSVPRSIEDPGETNRSNVDGTLNVLVAARDCGVRRLVYASSSSVYGNSEELPKHELIPTVPVSPYGVSKLAGELYFRSFWQVYGLETICLRYFNVFGPRQNAQSQYAAVIPRFSDRLLDGLPPVVYGDGSQSRDFTYVDNVVEANLMAARASRGFGEAFNIAAGRQITLRELAHRLTELVGAAIPTTYAEPRPGDIRHSFAAIDKAHEYLGYQPVVEFDVGLRRTVDWYRNGGRALEPQAQSLAGRE